MTTNMTCLPEPHEIESIFLDMWQNPEHREKLTGFLTFATNAVGALVDPCALKASAWLGPAIDRLNSFADQLAALPPSPGYEPLFSSRGYPQFVARIIAHSVLNSGREWTKQLAKGRSPGIAAVAEIAKRRQEQSGNNRVFRGGQNPVPGGGVLAFDSVGRGRRGEGLPEACGSHWVDQSEPADVARQEGQFDSHDASRFSS